MSEQDTTDPYAVLDALDQAPAAALAAALRAALALAAQWERLEHWDYKGPMKLAQARADSANDAGRIIRKAVTATLAAGGVEQ